jgi:TPR repeat protein
MIVAAAEALYRRGGADAVTLSAVAREVNFARGVIYAHFASRQDLIAAVAPPEPENSTEVPAGENYDDLMRAQAEALHVLTKQVIVPKPRQRDATDTALSRLDARMTVTEKSLAAIEQRTGDRLKSLDVETGALTERLHGLRQRLEKFEEKQTAALAQIRLDVHNLGHNHHNGGLAIEPVAVAEAEIVPPADAEIETRLEPIVVAPEEDAEAPSSRMADYLVSARRAANDAAEQRAVVTPAKHKTLWQHLLGKRRWAILAVAAVLVAWFDIYVFAHYQPAQGAVVPADVAPIVPSRVTAKPEASPRAQLVRGLKYLNGSGVPIDVDKARQWIERAARGGQPVAENLMGVIYQTGTGVVVNMPVAIGWYQGAAGHGNLKAMTNLGKLYAGGWQGGTNFAKAAEWFAKAAALGDDDAAFDLAVLYERGQGVARSIPQAYRWYAIAATLGDKNAGIRSTTLAAQLTPEERYAADAAIAAFKLHAVDKAANETPQVAG